MSVPRLVLCGLEPGPAVPLAAGALLAAFAGAGDVRPVMVGVDLPLWRLLSDVSTRAPRALDRRLMDEAVWLELYDAWSSGSDLAALVAVDPALDRWQSVPGTRAVDVAVTLDAPLIVVVDARERGVTAAAAACGLRGLARRAEFGGAIVVGGDERGAAEGLRASLEEDAGLPVLGWMPPQLSDQFARQYGGPGPLRVIGPPPVKGGVAALCREAAGYLQRDAIAAVASRRGFVAAHPRSVLVPAAEAAGLTVAVAWGEPLVPFALENLDMLKALGVDLAPLHLARDRAVPAGAHGLLLAGLLDEAELEQFAANAELKAALGEAVAAGFPILAFGGGALLMLRRLVDCRSRSHDLAGVLPAEAELLEWYGRPHYVRARAAPGHPYDDGEAVLHELFDLEFLTLERQASAYLVGAPGGDEQAEGLVRGRCLATTLVPSLPARPRLAARFVAAMREGSAAQ